jgi:hypothetical protein
VGQYAGHVCISISTRKKCLLYTAYGFIM